MKYQLFAYYNDLQAHATGLLVGEYAYDLGRLAANAGVKVPLVSLDALLDDWAATNTQPVSYTHLTLPTNREV